MMVTKRGTTMNKFVRVPFKTLDKITSVRPLVFFTIGGIITAFDPHYSTWGDKIGHVIVCIAGGAFIELLAITMAGNINHQHRRMIEKYRKEHPNESEEQ